MDASNITSDTTKISHFYDRQQCVNRPWVLSTAFASLFMKVTLVMHHSDRNQRVRRKVMPDTTKFTQIYDRHQYVNRPWVLTIVNPSVNMKITLAMPQSDRNRWMRVTSHPTPPKAHILRSTAVC